MAIILDAMGSDRYPDPEIQAAVEAADKFGEIILVGQKDILETKLSNSNPNRLPVRIEHASDVLEMEDKVVEGTRAKPNNSMAVGLDLLKNGQAQAFVSAGSTGAVMFNAIRKLGRIKGLQRPALTQPFPVKGGRCVVVDTGANADCRPDFLLQFAIMGSIYAEKIVKISNPRIGLLANGEEPGKGNQLVKDSYYLLEKAGLNFVGNVEPKEVYAGKVDVVVTDGFTGNIFLKTSEAVARFLVDLLRESITSSFITKIGGAIARPAFQSIKKVMDPAEYGASMLMGVDGLVFVGHGRSDARALVNAIRVAHEAAQSDLLPALRETVAQRLTILESAAEKAQG